MKNPLKSKNHHTKTGKEENINFFDPNKSFIHLGIFKIVIYTGIIIAALSAIAICSTSSLELNPTYLGFNEFIKIFKFPLGALATTIPIIALLAANHKSEQTKEQMRLATQNNNFTNHYKHLSEFESYIQKHQDNDTLLIKSNRRLHKACFPNTKKGQYTANPQISQIIRELIAISIKTINTTANNNNKSEALTKDIIKEMSFLENSIKENNEIIDAISNRARKPKIVEIMYPEITKNEITRDSGDTEIQKIINKKKEQEKKHEELKNQKSLIEDPIENENKTGRSNLFDLAKGTAELYEIKRLNEDKKAIDMPSHNAPVEEIAYNILEISKLLVISLEFDDNYSPPEDIEKYIQRIEKLRDKSLKSFFNEYKSLNAPQ